MFYLINLANNPDGLVIWIGLGIVIIALVVFLMVIAKMPTKGEEYELEDHVYERRKEDKNKE